MGIERPSLDITEYQSIGFRLAHAQRKAELHLLELVTAQHGDRIGRQGDVASATFGLWWLKPQPGFGFLKAALDAQRALWLGIQVYVAPIGGRAVRRGAFQLLGQATRYDAGCDPVATPGRQYLYLLLLDRRRALYSRHVAVERATPDGIAEHEPALTKTVVYIKRTGEQLKGREIAEAYWNQGRGQIFKADTYLGKVSSYPGDSCWFYDVEANGEELRQSEGPYYADKSKFRACLQPGGTAPVGRVPCLKNIWGTCP
jgi:hypothetical protein